MEKYDGDPNTRFTYISGGEKYRGAWYLHLSHDYNYEAFSNYLRGKNRYDSQIMAKGYKRIEEAYAWESAVWFWVVYTKANAVASVFGTSPDELTKIVNKHTDTYEERRNIYYDDVVPYF